MNQLSLESFLHKVPGCIRYSAYKDTGVDWLGEIPAHWEVKRLVHCTNPDVPIVYGILLPGPRLDHGVPYIGAGEVTPENLRLARLPRTTEEISNQYPRSIVRAGNLVYAIRGSFGNVEVVPGELEGVNLSRDAARISPSQCIDSRWLCYVLKSSPSREQFGFHEIGATITGVNIRDLKRVVLAKPPKTEQLTIADFLDRECARIDTMIAKKERLIELLQEKRIALISHAVTKGLNPDAPMKDSGIEWLGEIPAHWKMKRLKFIASICTGDKDTVDNDEDGQYPFFVRSQTIERINSYSYDCEAVLTAGDGVGVAKVFHYVHSKFDFHQRTYMFNKFRHVTGLFFFYYIRENFYKEVLKLSAKSTVDSLRLPMIQNFLFCLPDLQEQRSIVSFLNRETAKIDGLIGKQRSLIELLREKRTVLISAAVTGKIDIRGQNGA